MAKPSNDRRATGKADVAADRPSVSVPIAAESGGSMLGVVANLAVASLVLVARGVSKLWNAITADGTLAAAGRQGLDELGAALKALPDTIQVQEPGTVWNPTQGEIAANRDTAKHSSSYMSFSHAPARPWPSEVASRENQNRPESGHSREHDNVQDAEHSM
jgi:hypothetical protein